MSLTSSVELAFDLLVGVVGNADCTRASQRLHAGGDVDAVAVDIALVDDDVTDIDADAELDPAIFGNGGVALGHAALDFHGATHGIDCARKLDQRTVARGFDDAAAVFGDLGIDEFATVGLERSESAFLVDAHQAAVASNVGCEDSGQSSFDALFGHKDRPNHPRFRAEFMVGVGCVYQGQMTSALGQKQTCAVQSGMSAKCQKRTFTEILIKQKDRREAVFPNVPADAATRRCASPR